MHLSPNVNNIVLSVLPTIVLFQMLMVHLRNTQAFELDEPRTNLGLSLLTSQKGIIILSIILGNFAPVQPALFFAPFINDNVIDDNAGFLSGIAAGGSSGGRAGARRL